MLSLIAASYVRENQDSQEKPLQGETFITFPGFLRALDIRGSEGAVIIALGHSPWANAKTCAAVRKFF